MPDSDRFRLIFEQGISVGREYKIERPEIVIGRDPQLDLVIESLAVSRRHARLLLKNGDYFLEDLGSSNGTFLNDQRLSSRARLSSGDRIRLGEAISLRFEAQDLPAETQAGSLREGVPSKPDRQAETVLGEDVLTQVRDLPPRIVITVAGETPQEFGLQDPLYTIGRASDNDILIGSDIISRHHARLEQVENGYRLIILPDASNPVLFEGRPLTGPRNLRHQDTFRIGSQDPGRMVTLTYQFPAQAVSHSYQSIQFGDKNKIQIGRDPSNDVVLDAPTVSRFQVQIERVGQRYRVRDLRSANGTFINNQRIDGEVWLKPSDTIRVGPYRFEIDRDQLAKFDESSGLRVDVIRLSKWVRKDLNILKDISLVFKPREFIVVVGQSGGGKSTLVDAIAGYRPATHGQVLVNGIDVYKNFDAIRNDIGFVPQKDIIHMELTVYQALDYATQLRMPSDTSKAERHKRIMQVLEDLDLIHRKDVQISGLSGGQQKRVSIGVELLTQPGLFFLDEPTSGLDPGTETSLMQLMRRLADQGRTIILITHATKNVMLADKVVFLARGGYLAWFGPPEEALAYFDQYRSERDRRASPMEFDQIYAILDNPATGSPEEWAKRYRAHPAYQKYILTPLQTHLQNSTQPQSEGQAHQNAAQNGRRIPNPVRRNQVSALRQFFILSARNIKILTRDRFSLFIMLAAAPIIGLLDVVLAAVMGNNPFDFQQGTMANVITTLFLLTVYGVMVGGLSQMREFVKEREIYRRERLVNLKIVPYVLSKIWVAALLALYQAGAYVIIHYLAFKMPGGLIDFLLVYLTIALATMAGMMIGLFASALAPNANSAPLLVIVLMLPQIVLGGALIPLPSAVSAPTSTRWAFEALMSVTGVGSDVAADACWALPEELRSAMTLEAKDANQCRCMGLNALNPAFCNFPGIGKFYDPAIEQPPPTEPAALENPPDEPQLPQPPPEPTDQADSVAVADYLTSLQQYQGQVDQIQSDYKSQVEAYQARANVYQAEVVSYQEALAQWQIARNSAASTAEGIIYAANRDIGWTFVNKHDSSVYWSRISTTWLAQGVIITILFTAILILVKRKDRA